VWSAISLKQTLHYLQIIYISPKKKEEEESKAKKKKRNREVEGSPSFILYFFMPEGTGREERERKEREKREKNVAVRSLSSDPSNPTSEEGKEWGGKERRGVFGVSRSSADILLTSLSIWKGRKGKGERPGGCLSLPRATAWAGA